MRYHLILLLLLAFTLPNFAQNDAINWSEEYEDIGYYSIIGESNGALFVERKYNSRFNDRSVDLDLFRFNDALEITHVIELEEIEKTSYKSIATINSPEGLAHVYYQTTKQGEYIISAQLFNHENLGKTEIVDLVRFKFPKNIRQMTREDEDFQIQYPLNILLSRDKSKLAIMLDLEKVGKSKRNHHQYCVIDVNNGFDRLHQGDFYSDDQTNKYSMSDKHLSDSGKLTYAIKKYVRNNTKEHINKKPAYAFEIHHMSGDTMEYIYDIKVKKEYLDQLKIGSDKNDNLYISGYLRKQPFGDIQKSFLLSLDPLGYERYTVKDTYTKRDVKQITGKDDKSLDENFETIDIIPADNIVYLVRQYRRRNQRNSRFNNNPYNTFGTNQFNDLTFYWEYDQVVIEGIGIETGEKQWTAVNHRIQEDDNRYSRYFITGQMELVNNELVLIYNEREENLIKIRRKENLKRTDIPGDRTSITMAKVNANGEIKHINFGEEDYYHLPENGALISNNSIYFFNHHKNYKKFLVGKSNLSLIDF